MNQTLFWIALAGGEVFVVVFILLFIAWFLGMRQKGRDRRAINELVSRWASTRDTRKETLKSMLGSNYALSGPDLERTATELLNAEVRLVNIFSQVYLQRLADEAAVFDKSIGASVDVYHTLSGSSQTTTLESVSEPEEVVEESTSTITEEVEDEDELSHLRAENKRLTEELRVTMETMSRMLNEYSTMFASDGQQEVNVVMDVDAEAADAPIVSDVEQAGSAAVTLIDANPSELPDGDTAEVGVVPEAMVADGQSAEPEEPSEQEASASESVDPDEILAASATAEIEEVETNIEDDLSAVADVLEMVNPAADGEEVASTAAPVDEPEMVETAGSPYDLLEDAENIDGQDPGVLIADLEEAVNETEVDDIDALLAVTQEEQAVLADDAAEPRVESVDDAGDINEDFADLFDTEEALDEGVVSESVGEEVLDEELFDLPSEETVTEKKA